MQRIIVLGIVSLRGISLGGISLRGISLRGICLGSISLGSICLSRVCLGSISLASISRAFGLGLCIAWLGARVLLVVFLVAFLLRRCLADGHAVIEAEHDDDGIRLFAGEDALGSRGPVGGLAARLILNQAGDGLVLADHAHVGLLGIGIFQAIAEPVGHGVAQHQHITFRHRVTLGRPRRAGKILARRLLLRRLLERRKEIAAEPAAAGARGRTGGPSEIEELRRRRADDPDQKRDRNRQRHQRAGVGENAQEGLWLSHPARVAMDREVSNIVLESGRKRADFPHEPGFRPDRQGFCRIVVFRVIFIAFSSEIGPVRAKKTRQTKGI
ncbi:hypothetical protein V1288_001366 [Bradyrhizobium sp. AZCC 2176]